MRKQVTQLINDFQEPKSITYSFEQDRSVENVGDDYYGPKHKEMNIIMPFVEVRDKFFEK